MTQRQRWAFLVAAAVVVTGGCNRDKAADAVPGSDTAITTTVQARFFGDDAVKARDVEVDTDEGVVTLTGTVDSEAERTRAAQLAQQVEGVVRVENEISVEPPAPEPVREASVPAGRDGRAMAANRTAGTAVDADTDGDRTPAWITMKVQAQYFADDLVKGRRIDVYASRTGAVRLEGQVETDAERRRAVEIAKSTEGVTTVADHLRMVSATKAPQSAAAREAKDTDGLTLGDPWVTAKIESKYFLDAEVKGRKIDVATEDGIVTLTGEVSSPSERRQAVLLAKATEGVKEVRDQLRVVSERTSAPAARSTGSRMMAAAAPDDDWIETRIQSRFFLEDELKEEAIEISSASGTVTLAGAVDSSDAKETAEEIARDTSGVDQVVNRIAVETAAPAPAAP
jgi:hyperosmotically inducible protein